MYFSFCHLFAAVMVSSALAAQPQKPVLISYPDDTPPSVLEETKDAIVAAGGAITHEFNLLKGFAANVPDAVLDTISAAYQSITIEPDQVIHVADA